MRGACWCAGWACRALGRRRWAGAGRAAGGVGPAQGVRGVRRWQLGEAGAGRWAIGRRAGSAWQGAAAGAGARGVGLAGRQARGLGARPGRAAWARGLGALPGLELCTRSTRPVFGPVRLSIFLSQIFWTLFVKPVHEHCSARISSKKKIFFKIFKKIQIKSNKFDKIFEI